MKSNWRGKYRKTNRTTASRSAASAVTDAEDRQDQQQEREQRQQRVVGNRRGVRQALAVVELADAAPRRQADQAQAASAARASAGAALRRLVAWRPCHARSRHADRGHPDCPPRSSATLCRTWSAADKQALGFLHERARGCLRPLRASAGRSSVKNM